MNSQVSETTKRLRELIDNCGKTKKGIAASEALQNCDVSTITKHYNGDREVNSDFIVRYAKYFGVSTDYLLGLSDAATSDKTEEKRKEVETALAEFVIRISKKEGATPEELEALARIAAIYAFQ